MIVHIVLFLIFFKIASNYDLVTPESVDLDQENDKILAAVDDIFITLKVDSNYRKIKNVAEYILIHRYIQDAVETRNTRYNEMHKLTKITPDHKTAYYISNINKALREMISEYRVTDVFFDNNKHSTTPAASDDILNDFVSLAKQFRLNLNINRNIKAGKDYNIAKTVETRRVFGGQSVEIRDWPFVVSVHIAGKFACAGSIVREDLVLSAASCFNKFYNKKLKHEFKRNIWIRAGSDFFNSGGVMVRGVMLHFHSKYKPEEHIHNIIILQLKLKLRYKRRLIQPVRYARKRTAYRRVEIVGWGNKEYESTSVSDSSEFVRMTEEPSVPRRHYRRDWGGEEMIIEDRQLQHSVLGKFSLKNCRSVYVNHTITTRNFCAGYDIQGSGACKYDVGGPGVMGVLLQGVVSFGPSRCGIRGTPTVFTRVYRYARWLDKMFCKIPITNDTVDDSGEREALLKPGPGGRKDRKYSFVAAVFFKKKYVCNGAIIRRELVITVAACLKPFDFMEETETNRIKVIFTTNVHVRVGSDLYLSGTLIPVVNLHFHYNFDKQTLAFNVVILVLKHKIDFVPGEVSGIHVSLATRLKFKYKQVTVVGWGADCPANSTQPRNEPALLLRSVLLNRISNRACRRNYAANNNTDFYVSRLHHCLVNGGWGDDSLGNLVLLKNKLFGLVSVGCSRRSPNLPTVYVKIAVFSWWINSIMCRYKERYDPRDSSKISDYGSIDNVSSAEMVVILGRKIHCHDDTGASLNCTSINITTYYCEKRDGKPLKHGTPIECPDLDRYTTVNCTEGNVTEIDREDVSRSLINWPDGSTHNGAVYYCVLQSRNSSVRGCNNTNMVGPTCHETNCTENIDDEIIYCYYRVCHEWGGPKGKKGCKFVKRYCLDLQHRSVECPTYFRKCWAYPKPVDVIGMKLICKFKRCKQKIIDYNNESVPSLECNYETNCYNSDFTFYNCPETSRKKCIKINGVSTCHKKKCTVNYDADRAVFSCSSPDEAYCLDGNCKNIICPEYLMTTKCIYQQDYLYEVAFICAEEYCSIAQLLGDEARDYCRTQTKCYATVDRIYSSLGPKYNKTIECPIQGRNCRRFEFNKYSDQYSANYGWLCSRSTCTHRRGVAVNCIKTSYYYCLNKYGSYTPCFKISMFGLTAATHLYPFGKFVPGRTGTDHDVDENSYKDGHIKFTTYARPIQIQNEILALRTRVGVDDYADGDRDKDFGLTTFATPIQPQNDAPIFGARADVYDYDDEDPVNDNDMELSTYASPRQTQTNLPTTRSRPYADYDPDRKDDLELTTYASPIHIQNNTPIFRAQADVVEYADDYSDNKNVIKTTTYASLRQMQSNVPAFGARSDVNNYADDDSDNYNVLELTTYASPRQIQTNVPAIRARPDSDDDTDDAPDRDDGLELTTYSSPILIQNNAPTFRARADVDDYADEGLQNDSDMELTSYASPRQMQTNVPSLRDREDDDDTDDEPNNKDDDLGFTTYASVGKVPTNVPVLRAWTDYGYNAAYVPDKDKEDDAVLDAYEEKDVSDYTFENGEVYKNDFV